MLPQINLPIYEKNVPSTGQLIKFRPFTVKEQRILLLAQESGDKAQMVTALKQILSLCIVDNIDVEKLALFDMEFLFLNIAAKSNEEIIQYSVKCSECGEPNDHSINILDIKLDVPDKDSNIISLDDGVGIVFKYPSIDISTIITSGTKFDIIGDVVTSCIDYIFDAESVYYPKDYTKEEMNAFIDSLSNKQIVQIEEWFKKIPEVKDTIEFNCTKCGYHNKFEIKGIESFL